MPQVGDSLFALGDFHRPHEPRWTEHRIVGETAISWLLHPKGLEGWPLDQATKVSKKDLATRGTAKGYYTPESREERDWWDANHRVAIQAVPNLRYPDDFRTLRAIIDALKQPDGSSPLDATAIREWVAKLGKEQDSLVAKFLLQTGLQPSECEIVQTTRLDGTIAFHIQRRTVN